MRGNIYLHAMFKTIAIWLLYTALFSILIVATGTFFPFIGGKYYFFRIVTEAALACTVFWWAFEAEAGELKKRFQHIRKQPIVIAVTGFVATFLLATVFAHDPHAAFWSNFERGEGGFQMLHYYTWFVLAVLLFDTVKAWKEVFIASIIAASGMILYGVLAAYGQPGFIGPYANSKNTPLGDIFSGNRFQGSLGNPAYVAPYLMFAMFYATWLFLETKDIVRRFGYALLTGFFFLFFILSQTKGGFIGLAVAVIFGLLFIALKNKKTRIPAIGVLLAGMIVYGGLYSIRKTLTEKDIPGARLVDISFSSDTLQTRVWTWGSAWRGFKERPLFGWGPENFSAVFDKYFDTRHFNPNQSTETWFDRAHNVLFDSLAETGFIGFLGYLGMIGTLIWIALKKGGVATADMFSKNSHSIAHALLVMLPVGYFVQALALFDVLPIYINVFLFAAFLTILAMNSEEKNRHSI